MGRLGIYGPGLVYDGMHEIRVGGKEGEMDVFEAIETRRSVRAYKQEQINKEDLERIIGAAQLAPIAGADYTMSHITVVQDTGLLDEIREACMLHRKDGTPVDPLYGVPTLIVLSTTGPSDDCIEYSNVACAIENMSLAATALGLGSVYLWGFLKKLRKHPELIAQLGLPEGYAPLSCLGVGYAVEQPTRRAPADNIAVNYL